MYQQKNYLHPYSRNPNLRAHNLKHTTSADSSSIITEHPLAFVVLICLPLFAAYWTRRVRRQRQHGRNTASSSLDSSSASGFIALILTNLVQLLRQRNNEGSIRLDEDCEQGGDIDRKNKTKRFKDVDISKPERCEMEQLKMTDIHPSSTSHLSPASDNDNEPLIELYTPTLNVVNSATPQPPASPDHLPASYSETSSPPPSPPPPQAPSLSTRSSNLTVSPDILARIQEVVKRREAARMSKDGIRDVERINGPSFTRVSGNPKSSESKNPWTVRDADVEVERLNASPSSPSVTTPTSQLHECEVNEVGDGMGLLRGAENQLLPTEESVIAPSTSSSRSSQGRWLIDKSSIVLEGSLKSVRKTKSKRRVDVGGSALVDQGSMLVKGVRDRGDWELDEEHLEL